MKCHYCETETENRVKGLHLFLCEECEKDSDYIMEPKQLENIKIMEEQ